MPSGKKQGKTKKRATPARKKAPHPKGLGAGPGQSMALSAPVANASIVRMKKAPPVVISMREEVSDVTVFQGAFANSPMAINPANEELFPFLSKIAVHYETYVFEKLEFEYAANASSGNGGTVAIAVNPNADDPPFETMQTTLNREASVSTAPWISAKAQGKFASQKMGPKFVTDVTGVDALDNVFDDLHTVVDGVVNVVTAGLNLVGANGIDVVIDGEPLTINLDQTITGKFYVNYTVRLMDPILRTSPDEELVISDSTDSDPSVAWFGLPENATGNDGLRIDWSFASDGMSVIMTFPESGTYLFAFDANGLFHPPGGGGSITNFIPVFSTGDVAILHYDGMTQLPFPYTGSDSVPFKIVNYAAIEVLTPGASLKWLFVASPGFVFQRTAHSPLYLAKVNDSTTAIRKFGTLTQSPLKCPKSKGFLELHRRLRRQKGRDAVLAANNLLANTPMELKTPKNPVSVVKRTAIIDKTRISRPHTAVVVDRSGEKDDFPDKKMNLKIDEGYITVEPATAAAAAPPLRTLDPKLPIPPLIKGMAGKPTTK